MKKGGTGGGNTKTGLIYEGKVDLATFIATQKNYSVKGNEVIYDNKKHHLDSQQYQHQKAGRKKNSN